MRLTGQPRTLTSIAAKNDELGASNRVGYDKKAIILIEYR